MSAITPRSGVRLSHTPKISERKRALFQPERNISSCRRNLADDMKDDSNDSCDLGIISALDSSSSPERYDQSVPLTPNTWRSQTRRSQRSIKPNSKYINDLMKSPLTFKNYLTRNNLEMNSAPVTPQAKKDVRSPFSTEKYMSSAMSVDSKPKARKSLSNLIADTESCSSSLKDLTFDSDSGADSKENTPAKRYTRSPRKLRSKRDSLSNYGSGVDSDTSKGIPPNKMNSSPLKVINGDTFLSPKNNKSLPLLVLDRIQSPSMLKTPHDSQMLIDETTSPPKLHNRKFVLEVIEESPVYNKGNENALKRSRDANSDNREHSPQTKVIKLDGNIPKARLSLFNDKVKQFLTTKSFYPKSNVDLNASFTAGVSHAILMKYPLQGRRIRSMNSNRTIRRAKRTYGEINMGVRHKVRKPKQSKIIKKLNPLVPFKKLLRSGENSAILKTLVSSENVDGTVLERDKCDPFESEHQTIKTLLDQWTEEDIPEDEPQVAFTDERLRHEIRTAESLVHHSSLSKALLHMEPLSNSAVPQLVSTLSDSEISTDGYQFQQLNSACQLVTGSENCLPVEHGFILVDNPVSDFSAGSQNLEEIEKEIKLLDDQITKMAKVNNINAEQLLSPTSQMCDMASGLALASPKIVNGFAVTDATTINYEMPQTGDEIHAVNANENTADGCQVETDNLAPNSSANEKRLFPVFTKKASRDNLANIKGSAGKASPIPKTVSKKLKATHKDQYIIDAGQKKIGATQCGECGVIYQIGDPQDEMDHLMHHNAVDVLRFPGWKDEFVCGVWGAARCIRVRGAGTESGVNGVRWKRVLRLLDRVVHPQLGYAVQLLPENAQEYTAYLYVENRQIIGCLIAEIRTKANRLLPGVVDCCSREEYRVKCGISRLWSHISHRRRGVATHLVNSMRANFLYGQILNLEDLAFTSPTPAGRAFAKTYTGIENFFIYMN